MAYTLTGDIQNLLRLSHMIDVQNEWLLFRTDALKLSLENWENNAPENNEH